MNFTYTSFVVDHTFTLWQPIFRTIFIFSIIFLAIVIAKVIPTWITVLYAAFSMIIAGQLLYSSRMMIDKFAMNSNSSDNTIFIAICITNIISILVSISKKPKER